MFKVAGAVILVAALALYLFTQRSEANLVAKVGDGKISRSEFSVLVRGWRTDELRTILAQFDHKYELGPDTFVIDGEEDGNILKLNATKDIDAAELFYLVNYIMYPENFDLTHRTLSAIAVMKLSKETGLPQGAKAGQRAWIYIPYEDHDYDVAYVRLTDQQSYKVSFTKMGWEKVSDPRLPADVSNLIFETGAST